MPLSVGALLSDSATLPRRYWPGSFIVKALGAAVSSTVFTSGLVGAGLDVARLVDRDRVDAYVPFPPWGCR